MDTKQKTRTKLCGKCGEINPDLMTDESGTYHDGCGSDDLLITDTFEEAVKLSEEIQKENGKTINTARGKAKFVCIELEDENEKWNDNYNVSDGFFVFHKGRVHEVYKLEGGVQ